MQEFNVFDSVTDLADQRPFSWIGLDEVDPVKPAAVLASDDSRDQVAALVFAISFYQLHRKPMYINYMAGAKRLFSLADYSMLTKQCPLWTEELSSLVNKGRGFADWNPGYEIQRLYLYTGAHWTWVEWAWWQGERAIWKANKSWQIKRLERVKYI